MKNVRRYIRTDLVNHIGSLWQTDEFRNAHNDPNSPIRKCVDAVANKGPLWFYDMSDPIERTQFSSWWRHVQTRHYDIPAVTDLYYYHELTHIANHRNSNYKCELLSEDEWDGSVYEEEMIASLESEVFVYWYFPTLRAKTFPFEIWADRFQAPTEKLESAKWDIREARVKIFREPNFDDPIEMSIHKYNNQNMIWCNYWRGVSREINDKLRWIELHCDGLWVDTINPKALEQFEQFIAENTTEGVVFRKQTRLFHEYTKGTIITAFKG